MQVNEDGKSVSIAISSLARFAQDIGIILTVCGLFFGPLWYFNVQKPIADLGLRVEKLEKSQADVSKRLFEIDKNVAVTLEKVNGQHEELKAIRKSLEKYGR